MIQYHLCQKIKNIQILHSSDFDLHSYESDSLDLCKLSKLLNVNGHWVCSYYDTKNICIYDSSNKRKLHKHHEQFLRRLFPFYPFDKKSIIFPTVQQQPNCSDCGVFAIAFAISLLYNIKPEKVRYDVSLMRSHLIKIFESNVIEHFLQDLKYGVFQKVLPLAVIRAREANSFRKRTNRRYEKKQQKSSNKQKDYESQQTKKELNNNSFTSTSEKYVQSVTSNII